MSSSNDAVPNNIEILMQKINAKTNADKLSKCTIDLRDARIDPCEDSSVIAELFVITLNYKNKNDDVAVDVGVERRLTPTIIPTAAGS
ncbi:unnamed protein product [Rotaria sp. Silwood1]|nr:unnamed protein product [Rotaria sp. Silwood1]